MDKTESVEQGRGYVIEVKNGRKFEIQCHAGEAGALHVGAESLLVQIGQRVLKDGVQEMWHSVAVYANEDQDGNLAIRVLVFNPDWDEPLQIASITSRPCDHGCSTALSCDLNQVSA